MEEKYKKIDVQEAAKRLYMNDIEIEELIKKFLNSGMLEKVVKAFESNNIEEAELEIHTIKGAAANIGVVRIERISNGNREENKRKRIFRFYIIKSYEKNLG